MLLCSLKAIMRRAWKAREVWHPLEQEIAEHNSYNIPPYLSDLRPSIITKVSLVLVNNLAQHSLVIL
jgi:hypothetical protein